MSGIAALLGNSLQRLLDRRCPPAAVRAWEQGEIASGLWTAVEDMGLPRLLVPEAMDGAEGDLEDAALVMQLCGRAFVPLPLAETLLANRLLAAVGVTPPNGAVALALDEGRPFAWGGSTAHIVALQQRRVLLLPGDAAMPAARNLAGEPSGRLRGDARSAREATLPEDTGREHVFALCALLRAAQLAGAMERVVEMTIRHVAERKQFGRPLNRFQAVQHGLVRAAGEAAAARVAVAAAASAASRGPAGFEIAVAKARTSEAAGTVAAVAHQLHGAIGFTRELPLNLGTRRLWAWREDYGSDVYWQAWLGRHVAALAGDGLWPKMTHFT